MHVEILLALIVLAGILPSVLYILALRNQERWGKEPLGPLFGALLVGGTIGVAVGILLSVVFDASLRTWSPTLGVSGAFLGAVVVAPFAEEISKALGLGLAKPRLRELEDGAIYGAALGLGFAATENILYGVAALAESGPAAAAYTLLLRAFTSTLLHAGTTALIGFEFAKILLRRESTFQLVPVYLVAVLLHAAYNLLVGIQSLLAFALALILVGVLYSRLKRQIRRYDALVRPGFIPEGR